MAEGDTPNPSQSGASSDPATTARGHCRRCGEAWKHPRPQQSAPRFTPDEALRQAIEAEFPGLGEVWVGNARHVIENLGSFGYEVVPRD